MFEEHCDMVVFVSCTKSGLPLFSKGNDWQATRLSIHQEADDDDDDDDDGGIDIAPAA